MSVSSWAQHIVQLGDSADAKKILTAFPSEDWKRLPRRPLIAWMKTALNDSHWLKQSVWLRIVRSGGCWLRVALCTLKVGFHYPSSRAELTARELGCIFWHPSRTPVYTGVRFPLPELTGIKKCTRVLGPSTRPVNLGSGNRPLVVKARNDDDKRAYWQFCWQELNRHFCFQFMVLPGYLLWYF